MREEMRECLPRAIRNRPEPRYNKGGAIVVKSTESLNSWYRSLAASPFSLCPVSPTSFWPIPHVVILRMRARNYPESGERGPSLFLLALGELCDYVTYTRVCVSLLAGNLEHLYLFLAPRKENLSCRIPLSRTKPDGTRRYKSWLNTRDEIAASIVLSRFVRFNEAITAVFEGLYILFSATYTWEFEKYLDSWDFLNM